MPLTAQWLADGQVVSALGLSADRPNIKISSTLGEAVIFGRTDGALRGSQGFQRERGAMLTQLFQVRNPGLPVRLYPNPCREAFYLETSEPIRHIRCYAMDGRLMAHWPQAQDRYTVSHLPKGIYILRGHSHQQEWTLHTLIIQ